MLKEISYEAGYCESDAREDAPEENTFDAHRVAVALSLNM